MIRMILAPLLVLMIALVSAQAETGAVPMDHQPLIIAHRGASFERPEHTRGAYELAIAQGADFIEPDLVMTRDGVLVARHENEISQTTDVASRPEFADRHASRVIDGVSVSGWFTEDFTLAELRTLRARERLPQLRPGNQAHEGEDGILTFAEVIAIAAEASARLGREIGIYPELKHPAYFAARGFDMETALLADLDAAGLNREGAPVFIQCFEVEPLMRLRTRTPLRLVQLLGAGAPYDRPDWSMDDILSPDGLARIATYADALGLDKAHLLGDEAVGRQRIAWARAHGLGVHVWTLRPENHFLREDMRRGDRARPDYLRLQGEHGSEARLLADMGAEGLFTDAPALTRAALRP